MEHFGRTPSHCRLSALRPPRSPRMLTFDFLVRHALHARLTLFLLLPPFASCSLPELEPAPCGGGLKCVFPPSSQSWEAPRSWLMVSFSAVP